MSASAQKLMEILKNAEIMTFSGEISLSPFTSEEDGSSYGVYLVECEGEKIVLKRAKNSELDIYRAFLEGEVASAPRFRCSFECEGEKYFLTDYIEGESLSKCNRAHLMAALDSLIRLQNKYWNHSALSDVGFTYEKSLEGRARRGEYLNDKELEVVYAEYLERYTTAPRTLCHDDLLPFNVIANKDGAWLIDWEYAGVLPYASSICRLIAHAEEDENAFFYMKDEDKAFALQYYYENLAAKKGIAYSEYKRDVDLFMFYEYCEWIMLANRYENSDKERGRAYLEKAKAHIKTMNI